MKNKCDFFGSSLWISLVRSWHEKIVDFHEQLVAVKCCFSLGKNAVEIVVMVRRAYKEYGLSKTQVNEWFSRFKKQEMSIEDQPRTTFAKFVISSVKVDQFENLSTLFWCSIQDILNVDLGMRGVAAYTALNVRQFLVSKMIILTYKPSLAPLTVSIL